MSIYDRAVSDILLSLHNDRAWPYSGCICHDGDGPTAECPSYAEDVDSNRELAEIIARSLSSEGLLSVDEDLVEGQLRAEVKRLREDLDAERARTSAVALAEYRRGRDECIQWLRAEGILPDPTATPDPTASREDQ